MGFLYFPHDNRNRKQVGVRLSTSNSQLFLYVHNTFFYINKLFFSDKNSYEVEVGENNKKYVKFCKIEDKGL